MTEVTIDYDVIGNAAAEGEDQQQMKEGGGGFDRPIPEEGRCTVRLQQYIELGKQTPKNPAHKPREQVMLRFEINSKKHLIEIDGDDGKKKIPNTIDIRLSKGGKTSRYGRLFSSLNCSGKYNHFAQMVGKGAWLAKITHNVVDAGTDKEKTYANLDKDGGWTFEMPIIEDMETGDTKPIPVMELQGDPKVFLYENPGLDDTQYKALWDTLFIEGEFDDGPKKGKSKNWIQELIMGSLDFPKSRLSRIVEGQSAEELENIDVPADDAGEVAAEQAEADEEKAEAEKKAKAAKAKKDKAASDKKAKEEAEAAEQTEEEDDDPLAALDL